MRVYSTTKSQRRVTQVVTHDRGTATAGGAGTLTLSTDAAASFTIDNDQKIVGSVIVIVGGTGAFQAKNVASYVAATRVATMAAAWPTLPDATSQYEIMRPAAAMELRIDKQLFSGLSESPSIDRLARVQGEEARESSLIS
jgi:hypothetical protein